MFLVTMDDYEDRPLVVGATRSGDAAASIVKRYNEHPASRYELSYEEVADIEDAEPIDMLQLSVRLDVETGEELARDEVRSTHWPFDPPEPDCRWDYSRSNEYVPNPDVFGSPTVTVAQRITLTVRGTDPAAVQREFEIRLGRLQTSREFRGSVA